MAIATKAFTAQPVAINKRARARTCTVRCDASRSSWSLQAAVAVAAGLIAAPAYAGSVAFTEPLDKAALSSPVHLSMSVSGKAVRPAADGLDPSSGHFHVLIDAADLPEEGESIPFDDAHKHYGKGQTEVDLELTQGQHKLTLQFANALHQSYGPEFAKTITVNVK